jgi:DHA1 family bicyclomycin/chloramphenicol resistance-like MFS transporter
MTSPTVPAAGGEPARRPPYAVLIAISAIGPLALNMFMPSIPGLQATFGASTGAVQLTLTVYLAAMALCQLLYGPLSDRYGRRPMLLAGLSLFVLASIACALATSIEMLIACRVLQALGGGAGIVLARAMVRDVYGRERAASVLGYITMAWVLAPMIAPTIGGLLDQAFSFRATFWVLAVIAAGVLAGAWRYLSETNPAVGGDGPLLRFDAFAALLAIPAYRGYVATVTFASTVFFSYLALAPFIIISVREHPPVVYGMWSAFAALGYMAGNFLSGRYSERFGNDTMIRAGNIVTLTGAIAMLFLALAGFEHPASLFVPMLICTLGNGLVMPNGITAAISLDPRFIGAAAGLAGFLQMSFAATTSQVVGAVQGDWTNFGFYVIAAAALLAALSHWFNRPPEARLRRGPGG